MTLSKPYSIARAELIADQISRFATQHVHQMAGHHANLGFWISEAAEAVRAIDGYEKRFRQLRDAQVSWVEEHGTKTTRYCAFCGGACEFGPQTPERPQRVPAEELSAAREGVRRAVRQWLVRLHRCGLISEGEMRGSADNVGVWIAPEDLEDDSVAAGRR